MGIIDINDKINSFVWGWPTITLISFVGVFLTVGLVFMPWRNLLKSFSFLLSKKSRETGKEGISPLAAFFTSLSGTVGTGNIAGVATAIYVGGPGALFYMWMIALFGMATKYAEIVLGVHYREKNQKGENVGGPMYFLKNGLKDRMPTIGSILGILYAAFMVFSAFFQGNSVQSNSISQAVSNTFNIPEIITGIILVVLVGLVIVGGVKRIAYVAERLVPLMIFLYVFTGIIVIIVFAKNIPAAFQSIFNGAFGLDAAAGGTVGIAILMGFKRGIFSNEAGTGTAAIAHASSIATDPIRQGKLGMLGVFIDTIVVCTFTGLIILVSGLYDPGSGLNGAALTVQSFNQAFNGANVIATICLCIFAFTTTITWALYGERCIEFLSKNNTTLVMIYRVLFLILQFIGAVVSLDLVWSFSDTANGLMNIPNLIGLIILGPLVFTMTKKAKNKSE